MASLSDCHDLTSCCQGWLRCCSSAASLSLLNLLGLVLALIFPEDARFEMSVLLTLQECPKLAAWVQEVCKRASVQETSVSAKPELSYQNYLTWVYQRYADASAKSTSAADFKD